MKRIKKLKLFKYMIISCIFLAFFIGIDAYATDENESYEYLLPMTIDYGTKPYMIYDEDAAKFALDLSGDAYEEPNNIGSTENTYEAYGFTSYIVIENGAVMFRANRPYADEYGNTGFRLEDIYSSVNAVIGVKTIESIDGNSETLIAIAFRGTDPWDPADLATDFNIFKTNEGIHQGFYNTATAFYNKRDNILLNINEEKISLGTIINDMQNENSQYKMIVTGHSLGGAVADVFVGHTLRTAGVKEYNVTAYTFGAPKSVSTTYANSANVKNIINIVNADDWVPTQSLSGQVQLGQTFVVTPSEQLRENNYGNAYVSGNTSNQYATIGNFLLSKGMHDLDTTYHNLLSELESNIQNFTTLNTVNGITINNSDAHIRNYSIKYIDTDITMGSGSKLTFDSGANVYITGLVNQKLSSRLVVDNGSNVYVDGDLDVTPLNNTSTYIDVLSGKLEVGGDVSIKGTSIGAYTYCPFVNITDKFIVHGNFTANTAGIGLTGVDSYIKVYGDTNFTSISSTVSKMDTGTIELLGNYTSASSVSFPTNSQTKVKLSGDTKQTVTATSIPILELANTSEEGVEFMNKISVLILFNHNNLQYVLHSGGTFVDYDRDGVNDNLDQYPMDATRW